MDLRLENSLLNREKAFNQGLMMNRLLFSLFALFTIFYSSTALAGFGYDSPYRYDSAIVPVHIEGAGIYNLVISVQFMQEPYDKKIYDSDEYDSFLSRLSVEWSSVAINSVLKSKVSRIEDLAPLKDIIEQEIMKLAEVLKKIYKVNDEAKVVFSISNYYLLEAKQ